MIIDLWCFVIIKFWYHMLTMLPVGGGILISKSGKMLILCTCIGLVHHVNNMS